MSNPNPPSSSPYQSQGPPALGQQQMGNPKMVDPPPPYPGPPGPAPAYGSTSPPPMSMGESQAPPTHVYYSTGEIPPGPTLYTSTAPTTTVIITGNCPRCRVGHLHEESNLAMCILVAILAFLFFPIGLLYFLCLPAAIVRTCDNCGYTF